MKCCVERVQKDRRKESKRPWGVSAGPRTEEGKARALANLKKGNVFRHYKYRRLYLIDFTYLIHSIWQSSELRIITVISFNVSPLNQWQNSLPLGDSSIVQLPNSHAF
jgi:hypothetical protein